MKRAFRVLFVLIAIIAILPFNVFAHVEYEQVSHTCQWVNQELVRNSKPATSMNSQYHCIYHNLIEHCNHTGCNRTRIVQENIPVTLTHSMTLTTKIYKGMRYNATQHWDLYNSCKKCNTCPYTDESNPTPVKQNFQPHTYNLNKTKYLGNGNTIVVKVCRCGKEKP